MNRRMLDEVYRKLQSFIAPGLRYSQSIYEDVLDEHCEHVDKWLDLGCGHHLLPPWRIEEETVLIGNANLVVGLDYDYLSLTKHKTIQNVMRGDIANLPFRDETFDLVTANMVFEHLDDPEGLLTEIARVLSKDGELIFHTPNTYGYATILARMIPESLKSKLVYVLQDRKEEDVFPAYYKINSPASIQKTATACGLKVHEIRLICSSAQVVVFPPIAFLELIWIRFLLSKTGRPLRTNIIAILENA